MNNLNTWAFCGRVVAVVTKQAGKGTLSKITLRQYSDGKEPKPVFCQFDSWHTPPPNDGDIITAWGRNEDTEWQEKRYPCRKCDGWLKCVEDDNGGTERDNTDRRGTAAIKAPGTAGGVVSAAASSDDDSSIPF